MTLNPTDREPTDRDSTGRDSTDRPPIYLDNNATTRLDPRVLDAMLPFLREVYGNAASNTHAFGRQAREAVERARHEVAALIGASALEIVFTSGATESDNLALKGATAAAEARGRHVVTTAVEHKAVLDPCKALERKGFSVTVVRPDAGGRVSAETIEAALRADTTLVSVMWANNEIGTVNPVGAVGTLCKARGVLFHTDAAQAVGRIPVDVEATGVDLLSLSGHKLYGPKGIGALYVRGKRPRVRCEPQMHGGGHEGGLRSGTLNVPAIVGLGRACVLAGEMLSTEGARLTELRDRLWSRLAGAVPGLARNGEPMACLPNTLSVRFPGLNAQMLMAAIPGVAISSGSACTTTSLEPSHVLRALGVDDSAAHGSVRFSLGRFTTVEEVEWAADRVLEAVARLEAQRLNPPARV